jgi:hypothetical protein
MVTKRPSRTVAETPLPLVKQLLGAADDTEVLVGGQALSVGARQGSCRLSHAAFC